VDRRLARLPSGHQIETARQMGWEELENGELLAAAAAEPFDVLLTVDQNIESQQDLTSLPIAVVIVCDALDQDRCFDAARSCD
jgi:hypothetical protein